MKNKNIKLSFDNNELDETLTFKDLYEAMLSEIETYKELNLLDELMEQKVTIDVNDLNGHVLNAEPKLFVGWLEQGKVCISSELKSVYEFKPNNLKGES